MLHPIVIYHMNCSDGTAAASVFLRKFPEGKAFPLSHGATDEDFYPVLAAAVEASEVYFLDCEIGHERFLNNGKPCIIIDHHIGKYDELTRAAEASLGKLTYIFHNEKSGASLAWDYFFPNEEKPLLIQYIEDVDIWRLAFGDDALAAREYTSMYYNQPQEVLKLIEGNIDDILLGGRLLLRYARQYMQDIQERIHARTLRVGSYDVPSFNITVYQSGLGNRLSEARKSVVILYTIEGEIVRVSIRSCEGQSPTALDIALLLGGGGHKHAAGAGIPTKQFLETLKESA